ncbi:hypothetical protein JW877_00395 [bacterium]|nr:hypothetical protein [bacterium]
MRQHSKKTPKIPLYIYLIFAILLGIIIFLLIFFQRINRALKPIQEGAGEQRFSTQSYFLGDCRYPFQKVITSTRDCYDGLYFEDYYYFISAGGLVRATPDFKEYNCFTVQNGLPTLNFTALDTFRNTLYISTLDRGLLSLKGDILTHYHFEKDEFNTLSALKGSPSGLLMGGDFNGYLIFDGQTFSLRLAESIKGIFSIDCNKEGEISFGTKSQGLIIVKSNNMVISVPIKYEGKDVPVNAVKYFQGIPFIATNQGIFKINRSDGAELVLKSFFCTGLEALEDKFFGYSYSGEIIEVMELRKASLGVPVNGAFSHNNELYYCTNEGIATIEHWKYRPKKQLSENYITSVSLNPKGLLIGTFEKGLNFLDPDGQFRADYYSERIRQINWIHYSPQNEVSYIATTDGLSQFKGEKEVGFWDAKEGIINNYISYLLSHQGVLYLATGGGLTIYDQGVFKNLYAFHGLVNNHVYTLAYHNEKLYIGTLGGISVYEKGNIVNNYTTSNTDMTVNWITALLFRDGVLWVGTYGGGLLKMEKEGQFTQLFKGDGNFEVNNNALYSDDRYLYVGTLDRGLLVADPESMRFKYYTDLLPSLNVTAVTGGPDNVYLGTDRGLLIIQKNYFKL